MPKSVFWFGEETFDIRGAAGCEPDDVLFFLPSGVRPVKGNLECLKLMQRVHAMRPKARFVAAGPPIDRDYAARFECAISECSDFAVWIKAIPPAAMRSAYRASDVVLNASRSEGLSNSLIEAIAAGRPILASDIQGNHWPVLGENEDAPAGLLYDLNDPEDFIGKALKLTDDEAFRKLMSEAACLQQSRLPDPGDEADGLISAYNSALDKSRTAQ